MFAAPKSNRRRTRRCNIMWPATIVQGKATWVCTILDVSQMGAKIEAPGAKMSRGGFSLQCERFGELQGSVIWASGEMAGLRFSLPPTEIMKLLSPHVPGLGRREFTAPPRDPSVPLFGRKVRAA